MIHTLPARPEYIRHHVPRQPSRPLRGVPLVLSRLTMLPVSPRKLFRAAPAVSSVHPPHPVHQKHLKPPLRQVFVLPLLQLVILPGRASHTLSTPGNFPVAASSGLTGEAPNRSPPGASPRTRTTYVSPADRGWSAFVSCGSVGRWPVVFSSQMTLQSTGCGCFHQCRPRPILSSPRRIPALLSTFYPLIRVMDPKLKPPRRFS